MIGLFFILITALCLIIYAYTICSVTTEFKYPQSDAANIEFKYAQPAAAAKPQAPGPAKPVVAKPPAVAAKPQTTKPKPAAVAIKPPGGAGGIKPPGGAGAGGIKPPGTAGAIKPPTTGECPSGGKKVGNSCIASMGLNKQCPTGYNNVGGKCMIGLSGSAAKQCPPNFQMGSNGACVGKPTSGTTCAYGKFDPKTKQCAMSSEQMTRLSTCLYKGGQCLSTYGMVDPVGAAGTKSCPPGQWISKGGLCVPISTKDYGSRLEDLNKPGTVEKRSASVVFASSNDTIAKYGSTYVPVKNISGDGKDNEYMSLDSSGKQIFGTVVNGVFKQNPGNRRFTAVAGAAMAAAAGWLTGIYEATTGEAFKPPDLKALIKPPNGVQPSQVKPPSGVQPSQVSSIKDTIDKHGFTAADASKLGLSVGQTYTQNGQTFELVSQNGLLIPTQCTTKPTGRMFVPGGGMRNCAQNVGRGINAAANIAIAAIGLRGRGTGSGSGSGPTSDGPLMTYTQYVASLPASERAQASPEGYMTYYQYMMSDTHVPRPPPSYDSLQHAPPPSYSPIGGIPSTLHESGTTRIPSFERVDPTMYSRFRGSDGRPMSQYSQQTAVQRSNYLQQQLQSLFPDTPIDTSHNDALLAGYRYLTQHPPPNSPNASNWVRTIIQDLYTPGSPMNNFYNALPPRVGSADPFTSIMRQYIIGPDNIFVDTTHTGEYATEARAMARTLAESFERTYQTSIALEKPAV